MGRGHADGSVDVLLLRHAHATDPPGLPDIERPLSAKGEGQADRVGRLLVRRDLRPSLVVSSPAVRALATAQRAAAGLGIPPGAVEEDPRIYEAGAPMLLALMGNAAERARLPMLVGHNPGFADAARRLAGLGEAWSFPKGAVAWLRAPSLRALRLGEGGRLVELLEP